MGKSASGKDRIYSILSNREDLKLKKMVLYTTRPIRAGEENGKEYFFTDEHQLDAFRNSGKLIESRSYTQRREPYLWQLSPILPVKIRRLPYSCV